MPSSPRLLMLLTVLMAPAAAAAQPPGLPSAVRAAADGISAEQVAWDLAFFASDRARRARLDLDDRNAAERPGIDQPMPRTVPRYK